MKLTLFTNDRIITEFLPEKCAGHYWIHREDASGRLNQVIAVEAERIQKNAAEAKWVIKSNNKYAIYVPSSDAEFEKAEITAGSLYTIREKKTGVIYKLFCEPLTDDRSMYRAYEFVSKPFEIKIGSTINPV